MVSPTPADNQTLRMGPEPGRFSLAPFRSEGRPALTGRPAAPAATLHIAANCRTVDSSGGDLCSLQYLEEDLFGGRSGCWGIVVADASGHGLRAARTMARFEAALLAAARLLPQARLSEIIQAINRRLCEASDETSFVTAAVAVYDPSASRLTYTCAGHPPILRCRHERGRGVTVSRLRSVGGIPLGIDAGATYRQGSVTVRPGDTLLFCTDGILDARSPGGECFGLERLEELLRSSPQSAERLLEQITDAVKDHEAGRIPGDDQTLLVAQIAA